MPQMSAPLFGLFDQAPHQGKTQQTREASASGARAAVVDRKFKIDRVRALWAKPYTMQEIAQISGYPLASVCSLKEMLDREFELVCVGTREKFWDGGRVTKRSVFQLAKHVRREATGARGWGGRIAAHGWALMLLINACAFCGSPSQGHYSIERDGAFSGSPQVPLCDACGGFESPSLQDIWARIAMVDDSGDPWGKTVGPCQQSMYSTKDGGAHA